MLSIFVLLLLVQKVWAQQCNPSVGPSGTTACIQLQSYNNQYQWAICLTNSTIKQQSGHRHNCANPSAVYCWYQCMLYVYSSESGLVTRDCSCEPGSTAVGFLPAACYSPSRNSCEWYRDCLEKENHCEASTNAYAIDYAEKFCRLYDKRRTLFSSPGQKWVDGVRRCLKVALVPLVRPWTNPSCQEVRQKALVSHTPCYLNPDKDVPSVCHLNCSDYFKVFWNIKGSFIKLDTAWESIKGLWNIESKCDLNSQLRNCFRENAEESIIITKVVIQKFSQREKRSTSSDSLPEADVQSRFADGVGSAIASYMKWNTDVMDWLAFNGDLVDLDNLMDIILVLADKKAFGIITTSVPTVNFDQTIQVFALAVENGTLPLQVDGYNVWVKSLALCSDKTCDNTQTLAVSDKPPKWNGSTRIFHNLAGVAGVIAVMMMSQNSFC